MYVRMYYRRIYVCMYVVHACMHRLTSSSLTNFGNKGCLDRLRTGTSGKSSGMVISLSVPPLLEDG